LLGIAWTLEFEILFYAIVGIAIVNLRCGIAVMLAWGIGIVAATIWDDRRESAGDPWHGVPPTGWHLAIHPLR
jgi:hypothetical protein